METYTTTPDDLDRYPPWRSVSIPPESRTKITDAILAGDGSVRVVDYGVIAVYEDHPEVVVPLEACVE
ncbi:MAG: hypothetical protein WD904_01580 [Dehalococcoidia bacterium]